MKKVVDIVNLNADASCLSSERWLEMLKGGKNSELYQLYAGYIKAKKKVTLGITGSTWSDINSFNPECIELLKTNPNTFEFIIRPYAHDIALLRSDNGFIKNLSIGIKMLEKLSIPYVNFYLPPEFMLTNAQVKILEDAGIAGTFINYARFKSELHDRIPSKPYILKGIVGSELKCIPFESSLTQAYLNGIHHYNSEQWNKNLLNSDSEITYSWRDGESCFFIPDGINRELAWLENEDEKIKRVFLSEILDEITFNSRNEHIISPVDYYPTHSFMAWMKESKTFGFVNKLTYWENKLDNLSSQELALWLQVINSDILSAIEKNSPVIQIKQSKKEDYSIIYTILRSSRGFEGEELLFYLEKSLLPDKNYAFEKKLIERVKTIQEII